MTMTAKKRNNMIIIVIFAALVGIFVVQKTIQPRLKYNFADESAIGQNRPVLLEFGSDYCRPCREMMPVLQQLDKQFPAVFTVAFVDIWKKGDFAEQHKISVIPTQIFFDSSGRELFRHEGFYPAGQILAKWKELGIEPPQ